MACVTILPHVLKTPSSIYAGKGEWASIFQISDHWLDLRPEEHHLSRVVDQEWRSHEFRDVWTFECVWRA